MTKQRKVTHTSPTPPKKMMDTILTGLAERFAATSGDRLSNRRIASSFMYCPDGSTYFVSVMKLGPE